MIVIVEFKKYIANAFILNFIIGKFSYLKKLSSIILFIINKNPEIGLYYIILFLNLAISLRVKIGREPLFDSQKVTK